MCHYATGGTDGKENVSSICIGASEQARLSCTHCIYRQCKYHTSSYGTEGGCGGDCGGGGRVKPVKGPFRGATK